MKIRINKIISLSLHYLQKIVLFNIIFCTDLNAIEIASSDTAKQQPNLIILANYQHGIVLPSNAFVRGNNMQQMSINSFRTVSLQFEGQTSGKKLWEQLYHYPRYGVGISFLHFFDTSELGKPFTIYGILSIPILRWNKFSLNSESGIGISFNWKSYVDNKYNNALGSEVSGYFDTGFSLDYNPGNGFFVNAGTNFTHFSNGALKKPNSGINIFGPKITLGYDLSGKTRKLTNQIVPEYQKQSECYVSFFTGWKNALYYGTDVDSVTARKGVYYSVYGFSATFNRQVSYKSKFGVGLTAGYMGAANSLITVLNGKLEGNKASFGDGLEISIFPSYELVINRLSLIVQPGLYLYRTKYKDRTPMAYQRFGAKFVLTKDVSVGFNMLAYEYAFADYIEWTIGYRFHL